MAAFRSRRIEWQRASGVVHGDLTIRGITRQVPLEVAFEGQVRDPCGSDRATFSAVTRLNREDFGMAWHRPVEAGGLLVSKEITINIEIETLLVS